MTYLFEIKYPLIKLLIITVYETICKKIKYHYILLPPVHIIRQYNTKIHRTNNALK